MGAVSGAGFSNDVDPLFVNYSQASTNGFFNDVGNWFGDRGKDIVHFFGGTTQDDLAAIQNLSDISGTSASQWTLDKERELLQEQRDFNAEQAQINREFQERMSNTAYQRAVEDLEKAGLNKWLAVTGGNGASASTPAGASASSQSGNASVPNPAMAKAILQFLASVNNSAANFFGRMFS